MGLWLSLANPMPMSVPMTIPRLGGIATCLQTLAPTLASTAGDSKVGSSDCGKLRLAVVTGNTALL